MPEFPATGDTWAWMLVALYGLVMLSQHLTKLASSLASKIGANSPNWAQTNGERRLGWIEIRDLARDAKEEAARAAALSKANARGLDDLRSEIRAWREDQRKDEQQTATLTALGRLISTVQDLEARLASTPPGGHRRRG